jgi:hypothetical protein
MVAANTWRISGSVQLPLSRSSSASACPPGSEKPVEPLAQPYGRGLHHHDRLVEEPVGHVFSGCLLGSHGALLQSIVPCQRGHPPGSGIRPASLMACESFASGSTSLVAMFRRQKLCATAAGRSRDDCATHAIGSEEDGVHCSSFSSTAVAIAKARLAAGTPQ